MTSDITLLDVDAYPWRSMLVTSICVMRDSSATKSEIVNVVHCCIIYPLLSTPMPCYVETTAKRAPFFMQVSIQTPRPWDLAVLSVFPAPGSTAQNPSLVLLRLSATSCVVVG
jgi:hypothetical protein